MMKLLIAGLTLIGLGLALVVFTDLNPAMLFIGGVVCTFIAVIHGATRPDRRGWLDPAGEIGDLSGSGDF